MGGGRLDGARFAGRAMGNEIGVTTSPIMRCWLRVASTAPGCSRLSRLRRRSIQRRTVLGARAGARGVNAPCIGPRTSDGAAPSIWRPATSVNHLRFVAPARGGCASSPTDWRSSGRSLFTQISISLNGLFFPSVPFRDGRPIDPSKRPPSLELSPETARSGSVFWSFDPPNSRESPAAFGDRSLRCVVFSQS